MFLTRTSTHGVFLFSEGCNWQGLLSPPLLLKATSMGLLYKRVVGSLLPDLGLVVIALSLLLGCPVEFST